MLVLNFYGGPCAGKSTYAAYFYSKLKMQGINCELITEYAKQKVWENNNNILSNQVYLFAKQYVGLTRLNSKVELAIMDSPLLLSLLYQSNLKIKDSFGKLVLDCYSEFENINYLICSNDYEKYSQQGRCQSKEKAKELGNSMKNILDEIGISYQTITQYSDINSIDKQIDMICRSLLCRGQ